MSEETTTIATRMQQLGTEALDNAEALIRKRRGDKFVEAIAKMLERIEQLKDTKGVIDFQIDHHTKRIAALRAGEFHIVGDVMLYNDSELNKTQIIRGQTVIGLE